MTRTVAAAAIAPGQLAGLYLTGGSSRVPLIARQLWTALGVEPQLRDDPKAVVALGALKAYAALNTHAKTTVTQTPVLDPPQQESRPRPVAGPVDLSQSRVLDGIAGLPRTSSGDFAYVAWSPDGAYLSVCTGPSVGIWNVADGRKVSSFTWRIWSAISALAWSPDGSGFATGQLNSGKVKLWTLKEVTRQIEVPRVAKVRSIAWNHSGNLIAVGGDTGDVCVVDTSGGKLRTSFQGEARGFFQGSAVAPVPQSSELSRRSSEQLLRSWEPPLAWRPRPGSDGELLAFGAKDGVIRGLLPATGSAKDAQVTELLRMRDVVTGLAWSPDGTELAACDRRGMTIWRPGTGAKVELTLASRTVGWPDWAQWTSDGRYVAGFHRHRMLGVNQLVGMSLWDAAAGAEVKSWYRPATPAAEIQPGKPAPGTLDPCRGIALSPSGTSLARVWVNRPPEIWEISGT
jgi:WD40 repeat protein